MQLGDRPSSYAVPAPGEAEGGRLPAPLGTSGSPGSSPAPQLLLQLPCKTLPLTFSALKTAAK